MSNIDKLCSGNWKFDAVKCFDCGNYNLLRNGESGCLKCGSKNSLWIDSDEPEMDIKRFMDVVGKLEEETPHEKIKVVDTLTKKTFVFRSHEDKEKFFNLWDKVVLEVLD